MLERQGRDLRIRECDSPIGSWGDALGSGCFPLARSTNSIGFSAMKQLLSITVRSRTPFAIGFLLLGLLPSSLRGQGSIESWGFDGEGEVTNTPAGTGFTQAAGGGNHSLALRADGSIVSWGMDMWGQVSNTPSGTGFTQVSGGRGHSLALHANGSIVAWGLDDAGQVSNTPGGTGFTQVVAGLFHSMALRADGSIAAWGYDHYGQVSNTPGGPGFTLVAEGLGNHSLALRADGSIESWGEDHVGQVSNTPGETGFTQVAGGGSHSLALRADGSIAAWGYDHYGQVSNTPGGMGFTQVSGSSWSSLARRADGSIVAWGSDGHGQVSGTPGGTGFTQVAAGWWHSLALRVGNAGGAYCFGDGTGAVCPCGANGSPGEGCANTSGVGGAVLTASGNAYIGGDTFQLLVSGIPGAKAGLCVKGSALLSGGNGNVVGDGLLCTSPQKRSQVIVSDARGNVTMSDWRVQPFGTFPGVANVGAPTYYQWWYRDPANTCSGSGFNFTNAWGVTWQP